MLLIFLWWYHDKHFNQEEIVATDLTQAAMHEAMVNQKVGKSMDDIYLHIPIGPIENKLKWWNWEDKWVS